MARGAGLAILAVFATAAHFVAVVGYRRLAQALPRSRHVSFGVRVTYEDGRGVLRDVMRQCTESGRRAALAMNDGWSRGGVAPGSGV